MKTKMKRYTSTVTLLAKACPVSWDELDVMGWDQKRDLFDRHVKGVLVVICCEGLLRDIVMADVLESVAKDYSDYEVISHTTPAYDGEG